MTSTAANAAANPAAPVETLRVSEVFGPTVQGEGPSLGQRAVFVRLMGCTLTCPSCDTPYTWDPTRFDLTAETRTLPWREVLDDVLARPAELVVITGGEPLIQQRRLPPLLAALVAAGRRVEIETNATITPEPAVVELVAQFNVSPKLARFGDGMPVERRIRPDVLAALQASGRAVFKFVLADPAELTELTELVELHGLSPVWVMPEGRTVDEVVRRTAALADLVVAAGFHLTTRLHVLAWGDRRGH